MLAIIRVLLLVLGGMYAIAFAKDYARASKEGRIEEQSAAKAGFIGFITDFFDTLGIGSFAPTVALSKAFKLNIPDKQLPGTLNVSHTIPVIIQALIFTTIIEVDSVTLFALLFAAVAGSYLGAGVIAKMDEVKIQLIMGVALAATAFLMLSGMMGWMPLGGDAIALTGGKLVIGVVGNFILGALMTAGVGLYAPCMALIYFLGMSPAVAFPIMMGSCAMLMPVASVKFIKEEAYTKKASLMITIFGAIGVLIAAYGVGSMNTDTLMILVIIVVAYTSVTMLRAASKAMKAEQSAQA